MMLKMLKTQDVSRAVVLKVWVLNSSIDINGELVGNTFLGPIKSELWGWVSSNPYR